MSGNVEQSAGENKLLLWEMCCKVIDQIKSRDEYFIIFFTQELQCNPTEWRS